MSGFLEELGPPKEEHTEEDFKEKKKAYKNS